jgi:hypothetical protein
VTLLAAAKALVRSSRAQVKEDTHGSSFVTVIEVPWDVWAEFALAVREEQVKERVA